MTKKFSVREVKTVVDKIRIPKPIGYMDRRWNLALDTLLNNLERIEEIAEQTGTDGFTNLRALKPEEKKTHLP